jgi:hypothetical protein
MTQAFSVRPCKKINRSYAKDKMRADNDIHVLLVTKHADIADRVIRGLSEIERKIDPE